MRSCPSCGNAAPEVQRFCGDCGAALTTDASGPDVTPSPGEPTIATMHRADRIGAFRAELAELHRADVLRIEPADLAAVDRYHDEVLKNVGRDRDVGFDERGQHLALGLRVVSLIGALAFAASAFYFFYRIWGVISLPAQVGIAVAAPAAPLLVTATIARRERSGYFTAVAALFALAGLVVNVVLLHELFNLSPAVSSVLACGAFAMLLAYAYGLRLPLLLGLVTVAWFLAGCVSSWAGGHWSSAPERPETFLPAGILLVAAGVLGAGKRTPGFSRIYRATGWVLLLLPIVLLATVGWLSFLPWNHETVETAYQGLGFVLSAGAVWLGISRHWKESVYGGALFFILQLYLKFVDWWWDWMPKYLFFLIVAVTAVASALVLRRLRALGSGVSKEPVS